MKFYGSLNDRYTQVGSILPTFLIQTILFDNKDMVPVHLSRAAGVAVMNAVLGRQTSSGER